MTFAIYRQLVVYLQILVTQETLCVGKVDLSQYPHFSTGNIYLISHVVYGTEQKHLSLFSMDVVKV
jgi:hypothetical protein